MSVTDREIDPPGDPFCVTCGGFHPRGECEEDVETGTEGGPEHAKPPALRPQS
jgi:hypothetical protein